MVNQDYSPSDAEEDVLEVFREKRETVNPYLLREETGHDKGTINTALTRLTSAGWVRKVTRGLYEFVEDPRDREQTDHIAEALTGWSHGDNEERRAASDHVARVSLEWLRNKTREKARKGDVPLDQLSADDPASRKGNTLWKKVIKPAWDHAAERGYVEKPDSRSYKWSGDDV